MVDERVGCLKAVEASHFLFGCGIDLSAAGSSLGLSVLSGGPLVTSTNDEVRISPLAIRFLLESEASAGSVASSNSASRPELTCQSLGGDSRGHE